MEDRIRRLYEMFLRVLTFMTANAADFQDILFVATTVSSLQTLTDTLGSLGADKFTLTAAAKDSIISKGDARDSLRKYLEYIAEIWRTTFDEVDGDPNKYRVPSGTNDQNLIAAGKSFAAGLATDKQIFIAQGAESDILAKVQFKVALFEQAVNRADAMQTERVGTNAAFAEPARAARKRVDKLAPVVKRVYRDNPRKLAEWVVASHVEKPPKSPVQAGNEPPA